MNNDYWIEFNFLGIGPKVVDIRQRKHKEEQDTYDKDLITILISHLSDTEKPIAQHIMENQLQYFYIDCNQNNVLPKEKLLKLTANVITDLMVIREIIGIQPLPKSPVGLVYSLQLKYESDDKQRMLLEVISQAVQAGTRKLQSCFNIEAMEDLKVQFGGDLEQELLLIIGAEISSEICNEVMYDLVKLASDNEIHHVSSMAIGDKVQSLILSVNSQANNIARTTRRGVGNFIVTSPLGVAMLQSSNTGLQIVSSQKQISTNALTYVGYLTSCGGKENSRYKVYCTLSNSLTDDPNKVKFLVGYKGKGETDTGYIYSPYITVMTKGPVVDPVTFSPMYTMMTRYGKSTRYGNDLGNSNDYYRLVELDIDEHGNI
ncbi:MAG: hypothetical protein EO766_11965 [Hydrotalea sp. AMD]|uniref:hypothetical protein n=1 Tax=Hydrotalea sp. AMD TaxID=2501297 RepID=UPI001027F9E7|nr:hypothetical protein [Hydrotalea sp. AMD]RWZ87235.1 MAG: hypothetical protein EO766_11965 [Hydrotalea sp. AMD]